MPEEEPQPIGQSIEEALVRIMRPDLLECYLSEKERHREEKKTIERLRKLARANLKRWLRGPLRERKMQELDAEHLKRFQQEEDRHARYLEGLRETIRDHGDSPPDSPPPAPEA